MIYFTLYQPIWQDTRLTTEQKLIANYLWHWTVKFGYSWASAQSIADTFGLDVDDVLDAVALLQERNHVNYIDCEHGRCIEFNMTKYE